MSYLPYARAPSGSWLLSGGVSVMAHVGLLAVLFLNVDGLLTFPPSEDPPLEADTRIELLRQDTLTNLLTDLSDVDVQDIGPEGNLDDLLGETAVTADPLPGEALALDPEDTAGALDSLDVDDTIDSNDPAQDAAIVEAQDTPQNSAQAEIAQASDATEVGTIEAQDMTQNSAQAEIVQASDATEAGTIKAQDITQNSAQAEIAQTSDATEAGTIEAQDITQAADLFAISIKSAPADTATLSGTIAPVLLSEPEQAPPSTQSATSGTQIGEFQQSDTIAPMQPVIGSTSQALSEASVGTLAASDTISVSPANETPQVAVVTSQASDVSATDTTLPQITESPLATTTPRPALSNPVALAEDTLVANTEGLTSSQPVTVQPNQTQVTVDDDVQMLTGQAVASQTVTSQTGITQPVVAQTATGQAVTSVTSSSDILQIGQTDQVALSSGVAQTVSGTAVTTLGVTENPIVQPAPTPITTTTELAPIEQPVLQPQQQQTISGNEITTVQSTVLEGQSVQVAAVPQRRLRLPQRPPTSRDVAVANLIRQIQDQDDIECLIALPSRFGTDGIGLSVIGSDDVAMIDYLETVLTDTSDSITQARILVGSPQCPALDFISANRDYPATRIGLRLEKTQIRSGGRLLGLLQLPTASSDVLLLLIDNNGVVQDLVDFTQTKDGILRFEVPMTRVGPLRDTRQLLLAVASQKPLDDLRRRNGQLAQDVFGDLPADLARNAALAVIGFEVR